MVQEYGLFIGGKWRKSDGKRFETHNPATGETLATFPLATKDELNQAVRDAKEALPSGIRRRLRGAASCSSRPRGSSVGRKKTSLEP